MSELTNMVQGTASKTWQYTEQTNKHTTHHTITLTKQRFTHEAQIKEAGQAMRQRTDLSLKEVNSVSTYFGLSRNLVATILMVVLAVISVAAAIILLANEAPAVVGIIFFVLAILFGVVAFLIYKKIKPSFTLEIETIIRNGLLKKATLSYGNATVNLDKKKPSPIACLFMIIIFPVGIIYLLTRNNKGGKYKFIMDPEVGNEIVDTIGAFLMDE